MPQVGTTAHELHPLPTESCKISRRLFKERKPMIADTSIGSVVLYAATILGIFVTQSNPAAAKAAPPLILGGHTLGEKLSDFRAKFPNALCQSPAQAVRAEWPDLPTVFPENSKQVRCLVDDPEAASVFPSLSVRFLGKQSIRAVFTQERLTSLMFVVDGSAVDELMGFFLRTYGPVSIDFGPADANERVHFSKMVSWGRGDEVLYLALGSGREDHWNNAAPPSRPGNKQVLILQLLNRAESD